MPEITISAVLLATAAAFILGGLWYGPFFSKPWMREMGVGRDFRPRVPRALLLALGLLGNLVGTVLFAWFVGPHPGFGRALAAGLAVGLGWAAPPLIVASLFSDRSLLLTAIDAGYAAAQFIVIGAVFALIG